MGERRSYTWQCFKPIVNIFSLFPLSLIQRQCTILPTNSQPALTHCCMQKDVTSAHYIRASGNEKCASILLRKQVCIKTCGHSKKKLKVTLIYICIKTKCHLISARRVANHLFSKKKQVRPFRDHHMRVKFKIKLILCCLTFDPRLSQDTKEWQNVIKIKHERYDLFTK